MDLSMHALLFTKILPVAEWVKNLAPTGKSSTMLLAFAILLVSGNASSQQHSRTSPGNMSVRHAGKTSVFLESDNVDFYFRNPTGSPVFFSCSLEGRMDHEWKGLAFDATDSGTSKAEEVFQAGPRAEKHLVFRPSKKIDAAILAAMKGKPYRMACDWYKTFDEIGRAGTRVVSPDFFVDP